MSLPKRVTLAYLLLFILNNKFYYHYVYKYELKLKVTFPKSTNELFQSGLFIILIIKVTSSSSSAQWFHLHHLFSNGPAGIKLARVVIQCGAQSWCHLCHSLTRQARVPPLLSTIRLAVDIPHDKKRDHNLKKRGSGIVWSLAVLKHSLLVQIHHHGEENSVFQEKGKRHPCSIHDNIRYNTNGRIMIYHK